MTASRTPYDHAVSLYTRRRREFVARLLESGLGRSDAEQLATEWEYEANRRGLDVTAPDFWRQARQWVTERRAQRDGES